jgi:hypothetical protein
MGPKNIDIKPGYTYDINIFTNGDRVETNFFTFSFRIVFRDGQGNIYSQLVRCDSGLVKIEPPVSTDEESSGSP